MKGRNTDLGTHTTWRLLSCMTRAKLSRKIVCLFDVRTEITAKKGVKREEEEASIFETFFACQSISWREGGQGG